VVLGLAFASAAVNQFREGRSPWGRELLAVLSFEAIVLWPVAIYLYLVHPDWSWMYWVDPASLPRGLLGLVLAAWLVALLGGYLGGWALIRRRGQRSAWVALGAGAATWLTAVLVAHARISRYGTYAAFHQGKAVPLGTVKLAWVLPAIVIGVIAAAAAVGWTLYSQGRRVGAPAASKTGARPDASATG
jgi:hypothetical protein